MVKIYVFLTQNFEFRRTDQQDNSKKINVDSSAVVVLVIYLLLGGFGRGKSCGQKKRPPEARKSPGPPKPSYQTIYLVGVILPSYQNN